MEALFELMATQHGVASSPQARALGITWHREQALVRSGVLRRPTRGVLVSNATPTTWLQRVTAAALAPGRAVISHGAAARLHGLDGFDRYPRVDVFCRKGWWPDPPPDTVTHFTRGPRDADVTVVGSLQVLTVGATLSLLAPTDGLGPTARALDGALRLGHTIDELREVALRWRRRGRPGPATLLMLLDERDGRRLPRSWFQRIVKRTLERHRIRLIDEFPIHDERGILIAELDLAEPRRRIGIECQSWRWHATPEAQHRDARRRAVLRRLGWEIVDVWWRDLEHPDRVLNELDHLLTTRPVCPG